MEEMSRAVEGNPEKLRPIVDKIFQLEELEEALEYLGSGQHLGKVCVELP